jgi:putative DNA primase/helicase
MMVHQIAKKLTVIDIQDSSLKRCSASQEWVQGSGVFEAITQLTAQHQSQILARRIPLPWAVANCKSFEIENATLMLRYEAKSAGIMLMSDDYGQCQFRPDEPWTSKDGKKPKYRTPKDEYDAFLAKHPEIEGYWKDLDALKARCFTIDGKPYLLLTEGGFKAIAGCMHDIPTVALVGVTMGLTPRKKGEPDLVPALKRLAEAGFNFIIAFDSDTKPETVKSVRRQEKRIAERLRAYGCDVLSVTGLWEPGENGELKGMDDFINNKDIEAFRAILLKAVPIGETLDTSDTTKKGKQLPPPSLIAEELAETYRDKLAWESEYQLWRRYGAKHDGVWDIETVESIKGLIHTHLRSKGLSGFNAGYISSITTILHSDLEVRDWKEAAGLIPLRDGVLDQITQELKPHAPGHRFTWQLPFKWSDRSVGCEPIEKFLLRITGTQVIANVLLAFLNCIVTRQSKQQRYLELRGGGGTGKSTFMGLARALAGEENTVSSQLKHLENNQFETAKFYGKLLGLFPDSERWQGEVSVLKQLTGQDPIRYERKGVQQCRDFVFGGMVILSANEAPESRDLTSGQERRKLTIELDIKVPEYEDADLIEQFKPFLPGLLKRVLDMPREEVTRLIKHTDREVPELAQVKWKQLCETNPIAGWLDEKAVIDPDAKGYIGLGDIDEAGRWLYANFCKHQQDSGTKNSIPMKRFSNNLRDLLKNQMKLAITEGRDAQGRFIQGIGLRCNLDPTGKYYPCPVTKKPFCDGFMTDDVGLVTVESQTDAGCDGFAGFSENVEETEKQQQLEIPSTSPPNQFTSPPNQPSGGDGDKKSANPPNPASASFVPDTKPAQEDINPALTQFPPSTPATKRHHKEFKVGDRVRILDSGLHHGQDGQVIHVGFGSAEDDYVIALDKESHLCRQAVVTVPHSQKFPILMAEPKNV